MRKMIVLTLALAAILVSCVVYLVSESSAEPVASTSSTQSMETNQHPIIQCGDLPVATPTTTPSVSNERSAGGTEITIEVLPAVIVDFNHSQVFTSYNGPPQCDDVAWVYTPDGVNSLPLDLASINEVLRQLDPTEDWSNEQKYDFSPVG